MNINGRHLVRHMLLLLAGSGERASSYLKQARRLSSLPPGTQRRPIIRSIRTLRIRQTYGLDFSTAASISPLQAATMLTRRGIFINFRGPSALNGRLETTLRCFLAEKQTASMSEHLTCLEDFIASLGDV